MSSVATACIAPSEREEDRYFDPDDYLLGILRHAVADGHNIAVSLGAGEVCILTARGEYFTDLAPQALRQFCCRPAGQYAVRRLPEREAAKIERAGRYGRNLDELMWYAALCASQGRLIKGCRRDDVVLLKHWPNLTRIAATPNAVRIAALLTRYPTSVTLAYRLLKISLAELNEFYSGAHAAGWAVAVNRRPEIANESELKPHRNRGLLALILNRIAGL